ncbi:hypothetical protein B0J12DRAFT_232333 [Macrophomina phaseolina]|uniref:Peptidase C14 caspase catalytic n=1 Tax=Macrophomina phaseolina TaxID=35725 RepID=A0ABQ8GT42_9PEZI|nr:hypothetical protein B0J12DRAFT_232333 [Macrophomina phaseolina]
MASKANSGLPSPVLPSSTLTAVARRRSDTELTRGQRPSAVATDAPQQANGTAPVGSSPPSSAADLQDQWTDAMARNMEMPGGYAQAAVLIVKWALHLDDLKCLEEVAELDTLFREKFHYETVVVSLEESAPQHQLLHAISGFLRDFDGPNNLLIIYYTGHSAYNMRTEELEFYARRNPNKTTSGTHANLQSASWNFAESLLLRDTRADTLAILDTCFASNVNKGGVSSGRAYQLLAASGPDRMTAAPGLKSFTTAMIQVLNEWLEEGHPRMTLWKLSARINEKFYRRQNPCFVQDRLKEHDRQIYLAPLDKDIEARKMNEMALNHKTGFSDLTLRFSLGIKTLTRDHIEILTKELPRACQAADVKLQRVDWVGFERRPPSIKNTVNAFTYAQHWLRETRRRKSHSMHEQPKHVH